MSAIARYFDPSKDEGGYLPGVPLRDLSQEEFDALPEWLQRSVDINPMYRKSKPAKEEKHEKAPPQGAG